MSRSSVTVTIDKLLKSRIADNIAALFGTQVASYFFPLLTIPYLARVLGPSQYGNVAFAQALGLYLSLVVDFGFQLSASRRIARVRDYEEHVAETVAGVLGAKCLLGIVCLGSVLLLQTLSPAFRQSTLILWFGALSGVGQGLTMLWLYQGFEEMKIPALAEVAGKAVVCAGVFAFVHHSKDAWIVLALQFLCYTGVAGFQMVMTYRKIPFLFPTRRVVWQSMRSSGAMFLFRSSVSLYTTSNALVLGALTTPVAVGFYSGAERPIKALLGLMTPISQALYPRISRLVTNEASAALLLTKLSLKIMLFGGSLLGISVAIAAPVIVRFLLGNGYEQAVPVLRVLALLLPAIAASTVLGIQWMLPLGMETAYNTIVISAGFLNLGLALCWAPHWKATGMACAVVVTEYAVLVAICIVLWRRGVLPLSDRTLISNVPVAFAAMDKQPDTA